METNVMIQLVNINTLKPSPFNPPTRIESKHIRDLVRSMENYGFWTFCPLLISSDGYIADGHRRYAAAKEIGIETIPVISTPFTADELWSAFNGTRLEISATDVLIAASMGLTTLPRKQARTIELLKDTVGDAGLKRLAEMRVSPSIRSRAKRIANLCGKTDAAFLAQTIFWMVDNKMSLVAHYLNESNIDTKIVIQAIEKNRPIRLSGISVE